MSQIRYKMDVVEVESIMMQNTSIVSLTDLIAGLKIKNTSITELINQTTVRNKLKISGRKVKHISPAKIKENIRIPAPIETKHFVSPISVDNESAIKTLIQMPFMIKNPEPIIQSLQKIMNVENPVTINSSVQAVIKEAEDQHKNIFVDSIKSSVVNASIESGFSKINTIYDNGKPTIVALDNMGRGIISEISINAQNKINISNETTGFTDGKCEMVMQMFDDELHKQGVKYAGTNKKWTGGNCILQTSKELEKRFQNKRNNEDQLNRTRKLNQKIKIKN